jgi:hypothetical protein
MIAPAVPMNTNRRSRRLRWILGMGLTAFAFAGCAHDDPKPTRPAGPGLGDEIFGALCDRVGAQALREDLSGASYQDICHGTASKVDASRLPAAPDAQVRTRAVAKIEALARHRTALVAALDVVFPDDKVVGKNIGSADPLASCDPQSGKQRREQLRGLLGRFLPTENETVPESSRALARSIEPLMSTSSPDGEAARVAMTHLAARRGYMPPDLAAGLFGSVLTAPRLRDMLGATMQLMSPDASPYDKPNTPGIAHGALQSFVAAARDDLNEPLPAREAPLTVSYDVVAGRKLLSRPRTAVELVREALLAEDPAFSNGPPLFVVRRDRRGMAVVAKVNGKIPAPFVDADNDGLADLDALGRFVVTGNQKAGDPFVGDQRDPAYEYIDARKTAGSALLRHIAPLADPDGGKESVLASASALEPLLRDGGRDALLDLAHAGAQIAADPTADELLALSGQLFKAQPQLMARVVGNLLDAKAVFDAHPEAQLPKDSVLVDDLLAIVVKIGREPGLLEDVLASLADDRAKYLTTALPPLLKFRDRMSYDRQALNGLPINLTTGKGGPPETLVDRAKSNTGFNRSLFQRFLQLVHDTNGVTACSKPGGILHAIVSLDEGATYSELLFPFQCSCDASNTTRPPVCTCDPPPGECSIFKTENLAVFYMQSIVGQAKLHFRSDILTPMMSPESFRRSTGLHAMWETPAGQDVRPRPELLNRLVFFDVANDSKNPGETNYRTNYTLDQLQGPHIGTSECTARTIDDPNLGDPDVAADGKIHGLRTCNEGQWLDQRDPDTIFALEYNHAYEALAPLTEAFVKHGKATLLVELLDTLHKHWSVERGVVTAEPALAEVLATDLATSLGEMARATNGMTITRCAPSTTMKCEGASELRGQQVLADGLRALVDPDFAARGKVTDRKGKTTLANGQAVTLFGLLRDAAHAEETVLDRDPAKRDQWLAARSRVIDEFLSVKGRGADAAFVDPGVGQLAPVIIDLLRSQRVAECKGTIECPALRKDLTADIETSLKSLLTKTSLDLLDFLLRDEPARRELGRMTSYLTRQSDPLAGAGDVVGPASAGASPSSTPFANLRGPGVLDQSIAALVDALGALGDLEDVRPLYPMLAHALEQLDPQLALLSRLNARAYDAEGRELCSKELDPEETIASSLSRLALPITIEGQPRRTALQIFLEAIADVNRIDPELTTPLEQTDYANVFKNTHELLTDPTSGLEQLYASVKRATEN